MNRDEVLTTLREHKQELRERFGVTELALFGSFARDQAGEGSDIDLLVSFHEPPNFRRYFGAIVYLEDLFGRHVDMATENELRPVIRPYVERDILHI